MLSAQGFRSVSEVRVISKLMNYCNIVLSFDFVSIDWKFIASLDSPEQGQFQK